MPGRAGGRHRRAGAATPGKFRSLMVGTFQDGKLVYMGRVGTGYSGEVAADLLQKLKPLKRATSPFSNAPPRLPT